MNCINGNCEITESPDYKVIKPMPFPTKEDRDDPLFKALFPVFYQKRFTCPEYYEGWQVGTGCHVKLIMDQMRLVPDHSGDPNKMVP
jgi:hypothetical protein